MHDASEVRSATEGYSMGPNQHIRDFLKYYCALPEAPGYAVLLVGPWGCGKTWLMRDALREIFPNGDGSLYVSLYGVRSFEDIEAEHFRLLHPILSSKPVRLLGGLAKGLLRTAIAIDIDRDGRADGSVALGIPNEKLIDRATQAEGKILVFDDLERCSISLPDLLGHLNQFVEHGGFKVLLLANESEIVRREESGGPTSAGYSQIKEKLVGRTFEVRPELDSAISEFLSRLPPGSGRRVLEANLDLVRGTYLKSGYQNLRILKHSLWDFDRLCVLLDAEIVKNKELIAALLSLFLAYSFEVRTGAVKPGCIADVVSSTSTQSADGVATDYSAIKSKYPVIVKTGGLLPSAVWECLFATGSIPVTEINDALRLTKHFGSADVPAWMKYWHGMSLTDDEFAVVSSEVQRKWSAREYDDLGVVLHVASLFFAYSESGLYAKSSEVVSAESRAYIDWMRESAVLPPTDDADDRAYLRSGCWGYGYTSSGHPAFVALLDYVEEQRARTLAESYPGKASELLAEMKSDPPLFVRRLVLSNDPDNRYYKVPILLHLDPEIFVESLLSIEPEKRVRAVGFLRERYQIRDFLPKLRPEKEWLQAVERAAVREANSRRELVSGHFLSTIVVPWLQKAIFRFQEIE